MEPFDDKYTEIPEDVQRLIVEITNETVNNWLEESNGLPITIVLNQLGFAIIGALEQLYNKTAHKD